MKDFIKIVHEAYPGDLPFEPQDTFAKEIAASEDIGDSLYQFLITEIAEGAATGVGEYVNKVTPLGVLNVLDRIVQDVTAVKQASFRHLAARCQNGRELPEGL